MIALYPKYLDACITQSCSRQEKAASALVGFPCCIQQHVVVSECALKEGMKGIIGEGEVIRRINKLAKCIAHIYVILYSKYVFSGEIISGENNAN